MLTRTTQGHAIETNKRILIVDRDLAAIEPLRQKLSEAGFDVLVVSDGAAAAAAVAVKPPLLVILDWNIPGFAAPEWITGLRHRREFPSIRLIILSALSAEQDVVSGLRLGADDYITKPFSVREVLARVSTVLRVHAHAAADPALSCDELVIDATTNRVSVRGASIRLSGVEYRLLAYLMAHAGRILSRDLLLAHVWSDQHELDERTVDVNVRRLRKILAESGYEAYIQTVRGFGYRFSSPPRQGSASHY